MCTWQPKRAFWLDLVHEGAMALDVGMEMWTPAPGAEFLRGEGWTLEECVSRPWVENTLHLTRSMWSVDELLVLPSILPAVYMSKSQPVSFLDTHVIAAPKQQARLPSPCVLA